MNAFESAMEQLSRAASVANIPDNILQRLRQPQRQVETHLPVVMDNGQEKIFTAYRVQYNNARGPYKGGIRFHPNVDLNEVKALSFWMAIKCAVANIPMGGGKGGVIVDPKGMSVAELERLSRAFARAFADVLGPTKDVPAPDVYTTPQIMQWMADEYKIITNDPKWQAVITGKPIDVGGSEGRGTATAQGGYYVLQAFAQVQGLSGAMTVAVQGFGNAGATFAEIAHAAGHKVVAVSDSSGGIFNPDGLNIPEVIKYKAEHKQLAGFPGAQTLGNADILTLDVDVLVPAALEGQLTKDNAALVKANVILELANGPTMPEADEILFQKGIPVLPDVLSNSGGVTVSYFEWDQNMKGEHWTAADVDTKLKQHMTDAFAAMYQVAQEQNIPLRTAAFVVALRRIAEAMK